MPTMQMPNNWQYIKYKLHDQWNCYIPSKTATPIGHIFDKFCHSIEIVINDIDTHPTLFSKKTSSFHFYRQVINTYNTR
jgi:hypothetical protein